MPIKEFALEDICLIFLDHDELVITVTPRTLVVSTRSKNNCDPTCIHS